MEENKLETNEEYKIIKDDHEIFSLEKGLYDITYIVNDSTSCRMESTMTIEIPEKIENSEIVLPNVLNLGDLQNGRFCVSDIIHNQFVFESIKIFDRFGNMVFFSLSEDICWDGKFNNQWVEQGVYTYVLKLNGGECDKNPFYKNGDITIL